jgi:hypothetical protein
VYLLSDPNSQDGGFARDLGEQIREKEKFDVELQQPATNLNAPGARHDQLLRECDGLLLYYEKGSENWFYRNFGDLLVAERLAGRRELKSKALLVGGANVANPGLTVIHVQNPFQLQQLEPFLAALRPCSTGFGGSAHAGG